ncbi:MAG: hypothetical protein ACI4A8_04135 [Muribaculaceae bacterium]
MTRVNIFLATLLVALGALAPAKAQSNAPRIVNLINFIRQTEPRRTIEPVLAHVTDEVLYQTVVEQIKILNEYGIRGTFLLQYDALINPKYQQLLSAMPLEGTEIGGWWEITQPHVEAAGIEWRGRFPWDWHANVGFSVGYTHDERRRLVDVYMEKFKSIFGSYPKSVGSWFMDSYTLEYMHSRYGVSTSCCCRDQIGTDGYNMWGGYWANAFYPSKNNIYMPAQSKESQIDVPIFRMLGSDPIYQYDSGLGGNHQGVVTLEPVYGNGGADKKWVDWFFHSMFDDPCMNLSYTQAGQENMFTWEAMKRGYEMQIPKLADLAKQGKIKIETLEKSGEWFRKQFKVTPPSAISAMSDYTGADKKTMWFGSRYYRANVIWDADKMWIRDIHVFNEQMKSNYIDNICTDACSFFTTLPLVDGNVWSNNDVLAGLRFFITDSNGRTTEAIGGTPTIDSNKKQLTVKWPTSVPGCCITMKFTEERIDIAMKLPEKRMQWHAELRTAPGKELPFTSIEAKRLDARFEGFAYSMTIVKGQCEKSGNGSVFALTPQGNKLILCLKQQ